MLVKICGVRTKSAALAAAKAGADFLGFNFVPTSKRRVTISQAKNIIASLPKKRPLLVGVFKNQTLDEIKAVLHQAPLNLVQLHGHESPKFALSVKKPIIKAFGADSNSSAKDLQGLMSKYKVKYFMLDRKHRGAGAPVDSKIVKKLSAKFPIILAGGLNPQNVKLLIAKAGKLTGVDVAGGVEKQGKQSSDKIKNFIHQANYNLL